MPTKNELQRQLVSVSKEASAYQEAFWALQRGDEPITLTSGRHRIQLLGLTKKARKLVASQDLAA